MRGTLSQARGNSIKNLYVKGALYGDVQVGDRGEFGSEENLHSRKNSIPNVMTFHGMFYKKQSMETSRTKREEHHHQGP